MGYINITENLPIAHELFSSGPEAEAATRRFLEKLENGEITKDTLPDKTVEDYSGINEHLDFCGFDRFLRSHTATLIDKALEEEIPYQGE